MRRPVNKRRTETAPRVESPIKFISIFEGKRPQRAYCDRLSQPRGKVGQCQASSHIRCGLKNPAVWPFTSAPGKHAIPAARPATIYADCQPSIATSDGPIQTALAKASICLMWVLQP